MPYRGAYCASKFALEALSDALRGELHGSQVYVSLIEPGPITSQFKANEAQSLNQIDCQHSLHQAIYHKQQSDQPQGKLASLVTRGPEAVFKKINHAINKPKPKARYFVTPVTYVSSFARRLLPTFLLDKLNRVVLKLTDYRL